MTKDRKAGDRLLREAQVLELVPVSAATLWRSIKRGEFPRPIRISVRAVAWLESEIHAWIAQRQEASHEPQ